MVAADSGEGQIKIVFTDNNEDVQLPQVGPIRTNRLDASTNPEQQYVLNPQENVLKENMKMIVYYKADADATLIASTGTVFDIPVRRYNVATKKETETYLSLGDFTPAILSGVNKTLNIADGWVPIAKMTVPVTMAYKLGHVTRANSTLYMKFMSV